MADRRASFHLDIRLPVTLGDGAPMSQGTANRMKLCQNWNKQPRAHIDTIEVTHKVSTVRYPKPHQAVNLDDRRSYSLSNCEHYQTARRSAHRTRALKKAGNLRAFEHEGKKMISRFEEACAVHIDEPVVWISYSRMLEENLGDTKASRRALQRGAAVSVHDHKKSGLFIQLLALRELKADRLQRAYRLALIAAEMNEDCVPLLRWKIFRDTKDERAVTLASRVPKKIPAHTKYDSQNVSELSPQETTNVAPTNSCNVSIDTEWILAYCCSIPFLVLLFVIPYP